MVENCPVMELRQDRFTKKDLEKRIERLNGKYDVDFYLQAQGSPARYALTESDGNRIVFQWGNIQEIRYLVQGMMQADRYD